MRRRTKAIIVGTFTGSALLGGTGLAMAHEGHFWNHKNLSFASQPGCGQRDDARVATSAKGDDNEREGDDRGGSGAGRNCRPSVKPSTAPTGKVTPTPAKPTPVPTATTTTAKPPTPTPAPTTASPSCTSYTGAAAAVGGPGTGTVTVTIKVCGGVVTSASGSQPTSNYNGNTGAMAAMDALVPANYKTNLTAIHYSGVTYTSTAYQTSLKSALTKAGL